MTVKEFVNRFVDNDVVVNVWDRQHHRCVFAGQAFILWTQNPIIGQEVVEQVYPDSVNEIDEERYGYNTCLVLEISMGD